MRREEHIFLTCDSQLKAQPQQERVSESAVVALASSVLSISIQPYALDFQKLRSMVGFLPLLLRTFPNVA